MAIPRIIFGVAMIFGVGVGCGWFLNGSVQGSDFLLMRPLKEAVSPLCMEEVDKINEDIQRILREGVKEHEVLAFFVPIERGRSGVIVCVGEACRKGAESAWARAVFSRVSGMLREDASSIP